MQGKLAEARALLDRLAAGERQRLAELERLREAEAHRLAEERAAAEHAARAAEAARQALEAQALPRHSTSTRLQAQEPTPPPAHDALALIHSAEIQPPCQAQEPTPAYGQAPQVLAPTHAPQAPLQAQEPTPVPAHEVHAALWSQECLPAAGEQAREPQSATGWGRGSRSRHRPLGGTAAAAEADGDAVYAAKADKVVTFARAQIGKPYVRGATGPSSLRLPGAGAGRPGGRRGSTCPRRGEQARCGRRVSRRAAPR